ncbi:hypothetical protein RclHR1_12990001 [Rhizophagus clarus]|uniref:Ion transport domain-containing protein n=1 Tax=Rhizophagus clarus TaxID=94130 RepID=A0A2Z6QDF8_9GLOM|nr:hypothetical protein RclHR1_12990001 [Rhizophagus clarus]
MLNFITKYLFNTNKNDSKHKHNKIFTCNDDITTKKEDYQIAICQDGKYAATFDKANFRIRILENTDHRPFKKADITQQTSNNLNTSNSDEIEKTIAHFKINDDFTINKFYNEDFVLPLFKINKNNGALSNNVMADNSNNSLNTEFKWSLDISNMQKQEDVNIILIAVSRISIDEDMKQITNNENIIQDYKKGYLKSQKYKILNNKTNDDKEIAIDIESEEIKREIKGIIYCLKLKEKGNKVDQEEEEEEIIEVTCHFHGVSGICNFINDDFDASENGDQLKSLRRFIILNFQGIYNFEFNDSFDFFNLTKRFDYPKRIRREFDNWHSGDCMKRLLSCIYGKYFLVTQYKNDVQSLEVYDLSKMELETTAKRVENKEKFVKQYNYDTFSVSRLQLCFTRGVKYIRLFYLENGLQVASRYFDEIETIYSLEFINSDEKLLIIGKGQEEGLKFVIWDLYDTGKVVSTMLPRIKNLDDCLARTSGNILQVDNEGKVRSVLKRIENESERKNMTKAEKLKTITHIEKFKGTKLNGVIDESHTIHFDKNIYSDFKPIVVEKEPWVLGDYERNSYCLYHNKHRTKTETLQLIVGRSTVQIWHQVQDDSKNKVELPNKGEPFLEYIWTNRIPVNQEREETKLHIGEFKHGSSDDRLNDFYLKVYWYEDVDCNKRVKVKEGNIKEKDKDDKLRKAGIKEVNNMKRCVKEIMRKDITEKFQAIRHACNALEHLNKRYKSKCLADNYNRVHKYEEIVTYVKHIIWRFVKHKPNDFMLLDVRYNFMKSLILGDSDHLIKYTLFGDGREQKEFEIRHIPRNILWPGEKFLRDDDLDLDRFDRKDDRPDDNEEIKPENNMELAIYHCKGRELKDTNIVAYFLEYYSRNATDCAGWMSTVSTAIPLLFKYNYDDYARKLFNKECFADQNHFSAQEPDEIIPTEYLERRNHNIKFRAFRPIVKLKSDKYEWCDGILNLFKLSFKHKIYKYFEDFDNDLGKSPLALRVVPLPAFTINDISKKKVANYDFKKIILNLLWIVFVPRSYKVRRNERNKLSPFSRMLLYEDNDNIYDNPATEAVINFRWQEARNFFFFDIISIVFSVTVMTIMLKNFHFSDGFGSVIEPNTELIVGISFSIFLLWIELILYLRLISSKENIRFILKFVLLRNPKNIKINETLYTGSAADTTSNKKFNITLQTDFDPTSKDDNPFASFPTAIEATYFWIGGNLSQRDEFDFWPIDLITLIASIFLVIILQNMLIAFMG